MKSRKAQLAVFVIIGIIILFFLIVFLTTRKGVEEAERMPELKRLEEIPTKFQALDLYIRQCIEKTAVQALQKLGDHGGYINPADFGVQSGADPTSYNAVEFAGGSNLVIPYWFYLKDNNKCEGVCQFSEERPPLYRKEGKNSIESQLDEYLDKNIPLCLDNFRPLREQFSIEPLGSLKTTVTVAQNDVMVSVSYPLKASLQNAETRVERFIITLPVHLRDVYELATQLTNLQAEHKFLEKDVLNLIVGFSAIDSERLPPMAAADINYGKTATWSKTKIKEDLKNMLTSYIPLLQVENTANYKPYIFPGDPLKESLYNSGMFIPMGKPHPDTEASFSYLSFWEPYFDLNCKGDICKPDSVNTNLLTSLFGLHRYNFAYDLSFPVLVVLTNKKDLNNQGYSFRFFLEANIRNNEPLGSVFRPLTPASYVSGSMFCDENKRNSGTVTFRFYDALKGTLLSDVQTMFSCAEETCYIGGSENGVLSQPFPVCVGGIVTFLKDSYLAQSQAINTVAGKKLSLDISLHPLKDMKFTVVKKKLVKTSQGWLFRDEPLFLSPKEQAVVTLARASASGEEEYTAVAEYVGGQGEPSAIAIAPGTYNIEIQLFSNESLRIPEEERCEEAGFEEKCYTIPAFEMKEGYIAGGLKLEHSFASEDFDKDRIIFYVVNPDLASIPESDRKIEDIEQMSKVEEYSATYASNLRPKTE